MVKNPFDTSNSTPAPAPATGIVTREAKKLNIKVSELPGHKPAKLDPAEALVEFAKVLQSAGLVLRGLPQATGQFINVETTDSKKGKKPGWYILNDGEFMNATYGNFKADLEASWSSVAVESMTSSQVTEYHRLRDESRQKRKLEQERIWKETAHCAAQVIAAGETVESHPYLTKKKLAVSGKVSTTEDQYKGWLMVPLFNENTEISSIQFINDKGEKRFMSGGRKGGCYYLTNGETDVIYIAEGYATGETMTLLTGKVCAVAWDAGNLMKVAENIRTRFPNSSVIIAGDNDHEKDINVGYEKASSAASALGLQAVFPACQTGESDFNDVYVNRGKDFTVAMLTKRAKDYDNSSNKAYEGMPNVLLNPPGILADVVHYYNATAHAPQPGFAVQTALALSSLICARNFCTDADNHSALYFLNIAKSTTGKEHALSVMTKILEESGMGSMIGGGYTSKGAIFTALMRHPRHISVIDELGRYMASSNKGQSTNKMEVITELMEIIGRNHSVLRPQIYSNMTKGKDEKDLNDRVIKKPSITFVAMTTPETLFANISGGNITDGFMGRLLVHESNVPRQPRKVVRRVPVPSRIIQWIEKIKSRIGEESLYGEVPTETVLPFDSRSLELIEEFEIYRVELQNSLERFGLDALPGRMVEMSMRMALIVSLAKNPGANMVDHESTSWAIQYVRHSIDQTANSMKRNISNSQFEADKKEILLAIRKRGTVTWAEAQKQAPFAKHKIRELKDIMEALVDAELTELIESAQTGRGRRSKTWRAIEK